MNKLMMKLTIGTEVVFFACLIVAYLYFWRDGHFQKQVATALHPGKTAVFTGLLVLSSGSFYLAEKAYRSLSNEMVKIFLGATLLLGLIFLVGQAREYYNLVSSGITISKTEFGSSFFTLTGFHALHVLIGLVVISIIWVLVLNDKFGTHRQDVLATAGLYWHFVDAVWLCVFTVIYLLPYLINAS